MATSLFRRYLSAAGYTLGSAVVGRGVAFVNTVLLVRWLGPGNYGVYAVLLSLLMVSSSFANLRLDLGLARYLPQFLLRRGFTERELVKRAWWLGVALSLLTSMGLLAFAGLVATRVYARPELTGYVRLIAPAIALTVIQQMGLSTLAGLQDYRKVAMVQVLASVLQLVASVAGWAWMGLRGAVLGYVASTGIMALVAALVARHRLAEFGFRNWAANRQGAKGEAGQSFSVQRTKNQGPRTEQHPTLTHLTRFSVGCLFASLISTSGYWCGTAILTRYRGFEAAALFSVAYGFGAFTLFAPGYLLGPALPFLSEAWAAGRIDEFRGLARRNFRLAVSLTVPIAVFFAVVARPLVALVYGSRFASAWLAASLLSLAGAFFLGVAVFNLAFAAAGRVWVSVALNSLWLALFAALSAASARAWGPAGVGLSFFLSLGVGYGVSCAYGVRTFGISKVGSAPIAASVLTFGSIAVWLASRLSGVALWLAGCAVALGVSATLLKAFYSPDELALTWRTISRPFLRWSGSRIEGTSSIPLSCSPKGAPYPSPGQRPGWGEPIPGSARKP
jgi:O-antigen/teichoic acid export membrane protein